MLGARPIPEDVWTGPWAMGHVDDAPSDGDAGDIAAT